MTTDEFARSWRGPLVVVPQGSLVPPGASFLARPGLPDEMLLGKDGWPMYLAFWPIEEGLVRLTDKLREDCPQFADWPRGWKDYLHIGDARFDGRSSPIWCLHEPSGRVDVVDIEVDDLEKQVSHANSSVAHLAASLLAFRRWAEGASGDGDKLRAALREADPGTWSGGEWSSLVDFFLSNDEDDEVPDLIFKLVS